MMDTIWTVIMNLDVSEIPDSSTAYLCIYRLLFRTVPAHAELTDEATIQELLFQKSKGTEYCS